MKGVMTVTKRGATINYVMSMKPEVCEYVYVLNVYHFAMAHEIYTI